MSDKSLFPPFVKSFEQAVAHAVAVGWHDEAAGEMILKEIARKEKGANPKLAELWRVAYTTLGNAPVLVFTDEHKDGFGVEGLKQAALRLLTEVAKRGKQPVTRETIERFNEAGLVINLDAMDEAFRVTSETAIARAKPKASKAPQANDADGERAAG